VGFVPLLFRWGWQTGAERGRLVKEGKERVKKGTDFFLSPECLRDLRLTLLILSIIPSPKDRSTKKNHLELQEAA